MVSCRRTLNNRKKSHFLHLSLNTVYKLVFFKTTFFSLFFITGIPESSEEDTELAQSLGLSWNSVLKTEEDGTQTLINSDEVNSPSRLIMRAEVNQLTGYTS